jgi:hypothetical protein
VKRIKFHFAKTTSKSDEWIEFRSPQIEALYSKTPVPKKTADKKRALANVAHDEPAKAKDPNSQGKAAKELGPQNGKKKTKGNSSSKSNNVARDETAKDLNSQEKAAKEPGAKIGKKKARLSEMKGSASTESNNVAHDETAKDLNSQGKAAKEPGSKSGKKKARLNETKGNSSSKSNNVAHETAKDPNSQGKAAKQPGAKNGKKKARLNETKGNTTSKSKAAVLSENKKRVVSSDVEAVTGFGVSAVAAVSKNEDGSLVKNAYERHGTAVTHRHLSPTTAGESPRFPVGMPSTSSATRPPEFKTDTAPVSSPFDHLLRLASVANASAPNGSQFDNAFDQNTSNSPPSAPPVGYIQTNFLDSRSLVQPAYFPPGTSAPNGSQFDNAFDQNIPYTSSSPPSAPPVGYIQTNFPDNRSRVQPAYFPPGTSAPNGSQFDNAFGQNIPHTSNGPPPAPPVGYIQTNFLDSRSRVQPANFPPGTPAPQELLFQRGIDQYHFQDRQAHNEHPPRHYR